ncbi:hypothetical protein WR25_27029 [Diploscapter pachys]|uniref:SH2 domain-containing protein n=1 Tax=Diploscapter pachys TaxID=2018661 RepID=A0A2A2JN30_9BILA|nr:hypothetical protein WR25_27029 [Diploscapter pachys]
MEESVEWGYIVRSTTENSNGTSNYPYSEENLFNLAEELAPKPKAVRCLNDNFKLPQYGDVYHGLIEGEEILRLLTEAGEGGYLIQKLRKSRQAYMLCFMFNGKAHYYRLDYNYDSGEHFISNKRFKTVEELVADVLKTMHLELHREDYIRRLKTND